MALGMEVGLDPAHIVLDVDTAPLNSEKGDSTYQYCLLDESTASRSMDTDWRAHRLLPVSISCWATVCKTVRPRAYAIRPLSVLSVCL